MSFSMDVKDELCEKETLSRQCQLAELAAFVLLNGFYEEQNGEKILQIRLEHEASVRKCFTIFEKAFNIVDDVIYEKQVITVKGDRVVTRLMESLKFWDSERGYLARDSVDSRLLIGEDCKRSFLKGCFLAAGSISTPEKCYHLEIVCTEEALAKQIREVLVQMQIEAKVVLRKKYYVVYLKEGDQISDLLGMMEASRAMMEFENVRIWKEVRNRVNRNVNCETANINKTAAAAAEQLDAIIYLRDQIGLHTLPDGLRMVAQLRLEMMEASLAELGQHLNPPVGKSGVNHRLRKIKELADKYRAEKKEEEKTL